MIKIEDTKMNPEVRSLVDSLLRILLNKKVDAHVTEILNKMINNVYLSGVNDGLQIAIKQIKNHGN